MTEVDIQDPFAHLKQRAAERSDRTVDRIRAGIAARRARSRKITAESLKEVTRELEPGFAGLSFQVIRRNARAYALYRESASAFGVEGISDTDTRPKRGRRPRRRVKNRAARASYDPLQRLGKHELVERIRALERELQAEMQLRGAAAYDEQALCARILRLETEIVLLQAERSFPS